MLEEIEIVEIVTKIAEPENMPIEAQSLIVHFAVCLRRITLSLEKLAEKDNA